MNPRRVLIAFAVVVAIVLVLAIVRFLPWSGETQIPAGAVETGSSAKIVPDYTECWLPPNIAPTNFTIDEPGDRFRVHVHSDGHSGFVIACRGSTARFPIAPWRELLDQTRGDKLYFDIYQQQSGSAWQKFDSIVNWVAPEEIDSFVGYRLLGPVQVLSSNMGTYQRELSTYSQTPILESKEGSSRRCVNCHTYANNDPDSMLLHLRGAEGNAMLVAKDKRVTKVDTRNARNKSPGSYSSWHPSGDYISLSFSAMCQFFHTAGNRRDVFMYDSDLGLYAVESNQVLYAPETADPDYLETFPNWSPDGRTLVFCRARRQWQARSWKEAKVPPVYKDVRFDLMRVPFDPDTGEWGALETVLSADDAGLSILEPRVSPDGRQVLVSMVDYGCFPVFRNSSDLYFVDLETGEFRPLTINSDQSDSWHSWSSNGRWIVFASKRDTGVFGSLYFSYVDCDGREHKPFLLPQKDPHFYDENLNNFNAPEFAVKPVGVPQRAFLQAIYDSETQSVDGFQGPVLQDQNVSHTGMIAE